MMPTGVPRGIVAKRLARLALMTLLVGASFGARLPTAHARAAVETPYYHVTYSGIATVEWTPFEINRAKFGAPADVVAFGFERIHLVWTAEGIGDLGDPAFGLSFSVLSGSVDLDNAGAPPDIAPPPINCKGINLSHIPATFLHVRYFPASRFTGLTLRDFSGGSFKDSTNGLYGNYDPSPGEDSIVPDFPLAPFGGPYIQSDNDRPECQANYGMSDWTQYLVLPSYYPPQDAEEWVYAELAPTYLAPDESERRGDFHYKYKGGYAGPLAADPARPQPALPGGSYSVAIDSNVWVERVAVPEPPGETIFTN